MIERRITAVTGWIYGREFWHAEPLRIQLAIPAASFNWICEEPLWRGVYVRLFPDNPRLDSLYPASASRPGIQVFPAMGWVLPFVLSTFFLGLACASSSILTALRSLLYTPGGPGTDPTKNHLYILFAC